MEVESRCFVCNDHNMKLDTWSLRINSLPVLNTCKTSKTLALKSPRRRTSPLLQERQFKSHPYPNLYAVFMHFHCIVNDPQMFGEAKVKHNGDPMETHEDPRIHFLQVSNFPSKPGTLWSATRVLFFKFFTRATSNVQTA